MIGSRLPCRLSTGRSPMNGTVAVLSGQGGDYGTQKYLSTEAIALIAINLQTLEAKPP